MNQVKLDELYKNAVEAESEMLTLAGKQSVIVRELEQLIQNNDA